MGNTSLSIAQYPLFCLEFQSDTGMWHQQQFTEYVVTALYGIIMLIV
jgi:hypothetical protein